MLGWEPGFIEVKVSIVLGWEPGFIEVKVSSVPSGEPGFARKLNFLYIQVNSFKLELLNGTLPWFYRDPNQNLRQIGQEVHDL